MAQNRKKIGNMNEKYYEDKLQSDQQKSLK